jgi:small nuclear ribonucleoprotein (snRNP)-like protein
MYENYERNVQQMLHGNDPIQGQENMYPQAVQGMPNQMYPQAVQSMPNQMYPTGIQGAYQPMDGDIKHHCRKYMNYHVQAKMKDGSEVEGIITDMDENNVEMLVPEEVDEEELNDNRQYGYGRRRFRRFRRRRFPFLNFLFFRPYPYYYPYYPYYPY